MKRIILILLTLVISIALTVAVIYAIVISRDNYYINKFDQLIPQLLEQYQMPGAAMALVRDGEVDWSAEYGLADKEHGVPVALDTVFQAASISKAVTSWGVMRLVENGQLELDAPVEQYLTRWHLPPSNYDASGVTIRRLLSHNAGLSVSGYPGWSPEQKLPSLEESLSGNNGGEGELSIIIEPGTEYSYSGGGFTLLQLVIEEVTGETFSAYMQREVLDPLGMSHSSFEWRSDLRPKTAVAYDEKGSPVANYLFPELAAAGLYSTAADLARFVAAEMPGSEGKLAGRGVLAPETLDLMFEPIFEIPDQGASQGLGQAIADLPDGSELILHWGGNSGWKGFIAASPDLDMGLVILTNSDNGKNLIWDVMRELLTSLIIERILPILIPALVLAFLICAFFLNKSLASHRQLGQRNRG